MHVAGLGSRLGLALLSIAPGAARLGMGIGAVAGLARVGFAGAACAAGVAPASFPRAAGGVIADGLIPVALGALMMPTNGCPSSTASSSTRTQTESGTHEWTSGACVFSTT